MDIPVSQEISFCPFRKATYYLDIDGSKEYIGYRNNCNLSKEEFLPCLGKKCMAYTEYEYEGQQCFECSLINKNQEGV